jgi:acetyl-CoA C-acetyltransferase
MREVYLIEAVRSPIGRRAGGLSGMHPADLLGTVQKAALDRSGIPGEAIGQVIGGCVSQVGEQTFNIARVAWLSAGLPLEVASTTVDSQCGSSQQATTLASGLVGCGLEDVVMACGLEMMSRVPLGAAMKGGSPIPKSYMSHYQPTSQFAGAQMIGKEYGITRADVDRFGLRSQELANKAWEAGHFDREVIPMTAPGMTKEGQPTGENVRVVRDEGLRKTSLEKLAELQPVAGQELHTAGTSSQVSDGASAVIVASAEGVKRLGLKPRARIVDSVLVGCDPVTMLKGPIPATRKVLAKTGLRIDDVDVFEVNEAFASVVLAWQKECGPAPERVNPNGGAIALGHPTGATGDRLLTTALHELERTGKKRALISMCCGGGLGTGTLIER